MADIIGNFIDPEQYLINKKHVNDLDEDKSSPVNPSYYHIGGIECIDAIKSSSISMEAYRGFLKGNIMKYLWRYDRKHRTRPTEDLHKAEWYLQKLIDSYENLTITTPESANE